jgi:oligopeptide/dipeptide ABC transporter ATP-binding protein
MVICDEAVSALDVSIQAQILDLLGGLQAESGLSYLFISHDLSVVREISHRIMVLYLGSIVEMADSDALFSNPQHPYTQQLISAVPVPDPEIEKSRQRLRLKGALASPLDPQAQLRFLPSRVAADTAYQPKLEERFPGHFVAEHDPLEDLIVRAEPVQ